MSYTYKVNNQKQIKKLFESGLMPEDVQDITVKINNPDKFIDQVLEEITNETSDWPLAVPPTLIIDQTNDEDCKKRARNIVDMTIENDLYGLKFLDFGCGEGHVSAEVLIRGATPVVGYDIVQGKSWAALTRSDLTYSTSWEEVVSKGPYDFIFIYDVLDHVMDRDPGEVLKDCSKVLTADGQIVLRVHPWISRHGSHLYTSLNRAWAHVIFPEEKLKTIGFNSTPTRKVIHPMLTYKNWINQAGLKIIKEDKIQEPVDDYFIKNELIKSFIQKHYSDSPMPDYKEGRGDLSRVMSFHFIDYTLKK